MISLKKFATRITALTESLIDVFIANLNTDGALLEVLHSAISDHFPIYLLVQETGTPTSPKSASIVTIQNIPSLRLGCHFRRLKNETWEEITRCKTAHKADEAFISMFRRIHHK